MADRGKDTEKKEYYISKKDVVAVKENPWSKELAHTIKKGHKITGFASAKHSLVNTETGETTDGGAVIGQRKVVDKEEFVKFFGAGLVEAFSLSKTAKDVFLTILHAYIEKNTLSGRPDQIYINWSVAKEDLGYKKSRATFTSGLNELCIKGFMAPIKSMEGFFWLNPNLFYKGDRMMIVKDYVIQGSDVHKKLENEEKGENDAIENKPTGENNE